MSCGCSEQRAKVVKAAREGDVIGVGREVLRGVGMMAGLKKNQDTDENQDGEPRRI